MSVCFRAAYHYYYKSIDVRRPPENSFWKAKLAIECCNSQGDGVAGSMSRRGRFIFATRPVLKIYHKNSSTTYYPYNQIYGCAIHELAHATHWGFDKMLFEGASKIVKESFANGIEVHLTKKNYSGYDTWYNRGRYTSMMRDLTDVKTGTAQTVSTSYHEAENDIETYITRSYVDRASGYTMREIEDAMLGSESWTQWRDNIKSKYPSKTSKRYVDEVFTYCDTK